MFKVTILNIKSELTQNEFDILLHRVSTEKQDRIRRFHFFKDAQNCLLSDVLARVEICRITGLSNELLEFSTNEYGKPFLVNNPHIHFNISHTDDYVTFAIADEPVGIDIETMKPIDLRIAERFFTTDETTYIMAGDQIQRFYEVWTKKESRIKWEGRGLHKLLSSFSVFDLIEKKKICYNKVFHDVKDICHVCSRKRGKPFVKIIDTEILLQQL